MDQYGSFRNTDEDVQELRESLQDNDNICFAWSHNQVDGFIVLITKDFKKLGTMPFGGNPDERVFVSLYGRGCNHFSPKDTHASYFAEKLNMDKEAAEGFAWLWTRLWDNWA
jgi:hypothetical protein